MKPRTALHLLIGIIVAVFLVFFASNLQAGSGSSFTELINAQKHAPVLWVVDVCAVGLVAGMWWAAAVLNHFQSFVDHQATQHAEQLDDMIERTNEIERINDAYIDRIERLEAELARQYRDLCDQVATLESAADARRKVFESETWRISEHAYRLFQSQLENNATQLEAVHIAIQYQRAELRRLRNEIREIQFDIAPQRRLRAVGAIDVQDDSPQVSELAGEVSFEPPVLYIEEHVESQSLRAIEPGHQEHFASAAARVESPDTFGVAPAPTGTPNAVDTADDNREAIMAGDLEPPDCCADKVELANWKNQVERLFHEADVVEKLTDEDLRIASASSVLSKSVPSAGREFDRETEDYAGSADNLEHDTRGASLASGTEALA